MLTDHYHNVGKIYNLDMLNSLPVVVLEMLVYSKPREIESMPALPGALSAGRITGVACRNQCVVKELKWGLIKRTVSLTVESKANQTIDLTCVLAKASTTKRLTISSTAR